MTTMTDVLRNALVGMTKRKPPTFVPPINISLRGGMTAQQVLNNLCTPPGWLLEHTAHVETRGEVEEWVGTAVELQHLLRATDPCESKLWGMVADQLVAVCVATNAVYFARQREQQGLVPEATVESALQRMARGKAAQS